MLNNFVLIKFELSDKTICKVRSAEAINISKMIVNVLIMLILKFKIAKLEIFIIEKRASKIVW